MPAAPQPTPSPSYAFNNVAPTMTSSSQGDLPTYAKPGATNTKYLTLDAGAQASGQPGAFPLVGWNMKPPGPGGVNAANASFFGGPTTYYSANAALQAYFQMTPDQKATIQRQLLSSGAYEAAGPDYYATPSGPAKKRPGSSPYDDMLAMDRAVKQAIATGQPLDTVLSQPSAAAQNAATVYQQNTMVGAFDQSDPAELRALADQQAQTILGRKATAEEKALAVSMVQGAEVNFQRSQFEASVGAKRGDVATQLAGGVGVAGGAAGTPPSSAAPGDLGAFMSAVGGQESGSPTAGGYGAVNSQSGALGRFQVMPQNWPEWSAAAGLGNNAPMTPTNQEIVARNQMSLYYAEFKDWGAVAVAWYAGEKTAAAYQADPTNPKWQKPQAGGNPSIATYAQSVVGKMNTATTVPGQTVRTQGMAGQVGNLPSDGSGGPGTLADVTGSQWAGIAPQGQTPAAPPGTINVGQAQPVPGMVGKLYFPQPGVSVSPVPTATPIVDQPGTTAPSGATSAQPTPAQLVPTTEGVYTQVNPAADIAEKLRQDNPQVAGARDIANILDAVKAMFHG